MIYRDYIYNERIPLYSKAMDAYALRQKTIAENIANATTPGYQPAKVKFEELFAGEQASLAGSRTNESHIPIGSQSADEVQAETAQAEIPAAEKFFSGESHVNIDDEMSELAQNQLRFRMAAKSTKSYFDGLSSAIKGIT